MPSAIILIVVAVGFAWNLGVHYTGAVMGMPYAARSIALWPALVLIAIMTIGGATIASGGVEATVGQHIINDRFVTIPDAIVLELWLELAWREGAKRCNGNRSWGFCAAGSLARFRDCSWPLSSNG